MSRVFALPALANVGALYVNPFWETGRRALDALAMSDPSVTREAQGGRGHGVSGDRAVQQDHTALSYTRFVV